MKWRAPWLLPTLLAACNLCKPTAPDAGNCNSDTDCPAGDACLAGSCQSLTEVLQNLSAIVTPLSGDLAPEQYQQTFDGTQANLTLPLAAPQLWDFSVPLPPTCSREEALPMTFRFTGTSIVPQIDWTFTFTTDALGNVRGALPAEQFYEWIAPATPCAAPIALTDNSKAGPAPLPTFLPSTDTLTVVGSISIPGSSQPFGGASVTIIAVQGSFPGKAISGTVTTSPLPGQGPGVPTFALPVPLTPVSVSCAPPPVDAICDGGPCLVAEDCAVFTLEVGPSAARPDLPTFDLPISGRFTTPDGGVGAGPILSLMGEDGMGIQLPIGPAQLVNVSGSVMQPGSKGPVALQSADVSVVCAKRDGGDLCPQGFAYQLSTLSGPSGAYQLQVPPDGIYTLTATPPPGLGLAPFSETVTVPASALDGGFLAPGLVVQNGFLLSGNIFDSTGTVPITAGQVQATILGKDVLVGTTAIQSGAFDLTLPPGQYLLTVHPADSSGLPDHSQAISLQGDVTLQINLYEPARLGGGVFAESHDGGPPLPVAAAIVQFFFITDTQAFGTVALPIASGITDAQGHFSVAVPSSTAPASQ